MANDGLFTIEIIQSEFTHFKIVNSFQSSTEFTEDQISRHFRKFGEIESIELMPAPNTEAFVTWVNDRSAYLAQLQFEFDRESRKQQPFHLQPADSWEQPNEIAKRAQNFSSADTIQTSKIFTLNEDCFIHLFKFLDLDTLVNLSDVCKLFNSVLKQYIFPHIRHFTVYNLNDTFSMPLAKMHRTLRCIGPHITDLKYTCNIYNDLNRTTRFLQALAQYIGSNLRRAQFINSLICEEDQIMIIAPILRDLESLEIRDMNFDFESDVDFEAFCPNLVELKLNINMRLMKCCKPWRRLRHLSTMSNKFLNTMTFLAFVEQNPQLAVLEIDLFDAGIRLKKIADHLPLLEKLTLDSVDWNLGAWNFIYIAQLQHLTEIHLLTLEYQHLRGICDCLSTMTKLKRISLHAYRPEEDAEEGEMEYERSLIAIARGLPDLREFSLKCVAMVEKTLIDFVTFASQLEILHIHWINLNITDDVILKIAAALKTNRPQALEPFKLFVNPADYMGINVRRNDEVRGLFISPKCEHFFAA